MALTLVPRFMIIGLQMCCFKNKNVEARMTFQEKTKRAISGKRISRERQADMLTFASDVDRLRSISKDAKVSLMKTLLDTRHGK